MILNILKDIYHEYLISKRKHARRALTYLIEERQLNKKTIDHFQIGFCRDGHAYRALNKLGVSDETMTDSKMFNLYNNQIQESFHNLIVIPILFDNKAVHFTGRYVSNDWIALKQNSAHKHRSGRFQWAFNEDELDESKYIVIVESPIDCMTLWQNNIHAIATFGINGLSDVVAMRIKNKVQQIYISYDKDENNSGSKGAARLAGLLWKLGMKPHMLQWPESKNKMDVNTFFTDHNRKDFLELLKMANKYEHVERKEKFHVSVPMEIERIARHYFKLQSINRGYLIPCPYHKDKKPSMHLFTDTNEFYCYGCNITGKPLQLLMYMEKNFGNELSIKDAIKFYKTL